MAGYSYNPHPLPQKGRMRIGGHSRGNGNPEKHWIPGQARNDPAVAGYNTYVVMFDQPVLSTLANFYNRGTKRVMNHMTDGEAK